MGRKLDLSIMLVPLGGILTVAALVAARPEQAFSALAQLRGLFGNQLGAYYIVVGLGVFLSSLYMAFSRYGNIVLGKTNKPRYSNLQWGLMVFSATMGADIIYWSLIEWAYYERTSHSPAWGRARMGFDLSLIPLGADSLELLHHPGGGLRIYAARAGKRQTKISETCPAAGQQGRWLDGEGHQPGCSLRPFGRYYYHPRSGDAPLSQRLSAP